MLERLRLYQRTVLNGDRESRKVFGGRDQSAGGYLVAGIHQRRIAPISVELAIDRRRVAAGAVRDDRVNVVHLRMQHSGRLENSLTQIFWICHSRSALDRHAKQGVSKSGVGVFRAWLLFERVVLKNRESIGQTWITNCALVFTAPVATN